MNTCDPRSDHASHTVCEIGYVERGDAGARLHLFREHRESLLELDSFSHAEVLWWFDECDDEQLRHTRTFDPPFEAPTLGVFASRAPTRPNPIALSTVVIRSVDLENGVVEIGEIDATDGSPLLDIKPYMPHYGRVRTCRVPDWASGWPAWMPAEGVELDAPPK